MDGSMRFFKENAEPQDHMSYFCCNCSPFLSFLFPDLEKVLDHLLIIFSFSGQNYVQSDPQQRLVKLKVGGRAKVFRQGFQSHRFNYRTGCPKTSGFFIVFLLNRVSSHKWFSTNRVLYHPCQPQMVFN